MAIYTTEESMNASKTAKLSLKDVFKVFGDRPDKAMSQLRSGKSKTEIHKDTGCTIGVDGASFEIMDGEIFVIMGLSGSYHDGAARLTHAWTFW